MRAAIGVLGELFITAGVVVLLFLGYQLWWTNVVYGAEHADTVVSLEKTFARPAVATKPAAVPAPKVGEAFAVLRIPRFGKDYRQPIIEGTSHEELDRGVGHYTGTAMPGQVGNFATAGHRVTYDNPYNQIADMRDGDRAIVETAWGWYVYKAYDRKIVLPSHGEAIAPVPEHPGQKPTKAYMVMTACHPEFSAKERYVEYLVLEATFPRAKGLPASYLVAAP